MARTKIDYSAIINEKPRTGRFDVENNFPVNHSRPVQHRQLGEECEAVQRSFEAKREVGRALVLPHSREG